jgi:hypothetical protein
MASVEEAFRRLAIGDPQFVAVVANHGAPSKTVPRLDPRSEALLRIAALVALDAPSTSYRAAVDAAQRSGARLEDIFAVLVAIADEVGSARTISAAPRLALAAGYDVEADLE